MIVSMEVNSVVIIPKDNNGNYEHESGEDEGAERDWETRCKMPRTMNQSEQMKDEMGRFSAVLKDSDEGKKTLEGKKLLVEERKLGVEERMHSADCKERRRQREKDCKKLTMGRKSIKRLEIGKFCMMLEMMKSYKQF